LIALLGCLLLVGCVTVEPSTTPAPTRGASAAPSIEPTTPAPATASAGPAPTDSPAPTASTSPTAEPTSPPSEEPSAEPTAEASGTPSSEPTGPPARDLLFEDAMDDPSSGWSTLSQDFATISFDGDVLAFHFDSGGAWAYTSRSLDLPQAVLRAIGRFEPQDEGAFGMFCGDSTTNTYYGAVVTTDGGLIFLQLTGNNQTTLERHDELGLDVPIGGDATLGVQCTGATDTSGLVIEAVIGGDGPVAVYTQGNGPATFDLVTAYGEAIADGLNVALARTAAYGLSEIMSPEADELISHIPLEFQNACAESPVPPLFAERASAVVTCIEQTSGDGAEIAEYVQFDSSDLMNAAYQDRIDAFGVASEGTCQSGPNETTWSISGTVYGRVQCAPQDVGIRFDWTDERLSILASLVDFEGDYGPTFDQWVNAGPYE
jgi:hypothetical protein